MMSKYHTRNIFKIFFLFISLFFYTCESDQNLLTENIDYSLSKLIVISNNIPSDVDEIFATLSNTKYGSLSEEFTITYDSATCIFNQVPAGKWILLVQAYYEKNLTYQGGANVEVNEGMTSYVNVFMNKVDGVGSIYIGLIWDSTQYTNYGYNFDNSDLSGWSGPADATIVDGILHLSSSGGYKWHTIAYTGSPHFIEGELELDIFPEDGRCSIETKGDTYGSGILNWGILIYFRHDSLFVRQMISGEKKLVFTNFLYEKYTWHHIKVHFNNDEGEKGKFNFWINYKSNPNEVFYLGEYDYEAQYGKLVGVNKFALSVGDPDGSEVKEVLFDNIRFLVK